MRVFKSFLGWKKKKEYIILQLQKHPSQLCMLQILVCWFALFFLRTPQKSFSAHLMRLSKDRASGN